MTTNDSLSRNSRWGQHDGVIANETGSLISIRPLNNNSQWVYNSMGHAYWFPMQAQSSRRTFSNSAMATGGVFENVNVFS